MAASGAAMLCALPGCTKLAFFQESSGKQHECCGRTHHLMEMVRRNNGLLLNPPKLDGRCQLSSCNHPVWSGDHDFCCKRHALECLDQTQSIVARKCELPGCDLPVCVETTASGGIRVHDFCGWSHAKLSRSQGKRRPDVLSADRIVECLEDWISNQRINEIIPDTNFFSKHPWNVITPGSSTITLIAPLKWKRSSQRDNTTIEGCHWKQQGKQESFVLRGLKVEKRNLSYIATEQHSSDLSFSLVEYVLSDHPQFGAFKINARERAREKKVRVDKKKRKVDDDVKMLVDGFLADSPEVIF
ncbi:hypothetical protein SELMODRAFT_402071 [Selaginella moellendorffii]|uniref:Uncharacterized protein n=1 Tax=Selaginella moellendorffii TaxID=88036 RepID=D8QPH5_SELML|nr:hypothetical protein SELMODRAFT_402071 [Selaginella moellendorffii]